MFQVKHVYGTDCPDLERAINKALAEIANPKDVKYLDIATAAIIYEPECVKRLCCECQYWQPNEGGTGAYGICHAHGKRTRFSDKSCLQFVDIRD